MTAGAGAASAGGPWARFDDLVAGTALAFDRPSRVLAASDPAEVVPVLAEVERVTEQGSWAFGYVAYEAAAGLDPRWAVHARRPPGDRRAPHGYLRITVMAPPADLPLHLTMLVLVSPPGDLRGLTPRELEVLGLRVEGASNAAIARALVVAPRTVAAHLEHILVKLAAPSRTLAAVRAERAGLFVPLSLMATEPGMAELPPRGARGAAECRPTEGPGAVATLSLEPTARADRRGPRAGRRARGDQLTARLAVCGPRLNQVLSPDHGAMAMVESASARPVRNQPASIGCPARPRG